MNSIHPEKKTLHQQVILFRILAGVLPIILLSATGIMTRISSNKVMTYKNMLQEIDTKSRTFDEAVSFNAFITSNKIDLERMSMAIPSESMLVGVIQDIESIIQGYDERATVKFSSVTPAKIGQDLIIPMNIHVILPLAQLPTLFDEFSKLPYILQILSSESQVNNDLAATTITLRLYVQEPFTGY